MRERPKLSAGEYLGAVYAVSRGVLAASWAALTGWRRGDDGAKSYGQHIIYSAARTTIPLISIKVNQAILGTTRNQYRIWTKKNKIAEDIVEIDKSTGLWGCWLGRKEAAMEGGKKGKTLLWLHGGGYVFAASEGHLKFLWNMVQEARKRGQVLQVLVLEYDLAPHAVYPEQLRQSVRALNYLLDTGLHPSEILVGGDSAGGNLGLALLLHLSQPHPEVAPLSLPSNIAGALLVSPWVTFDTNSASFVKNRKKDILEKSCLEAWSEAFLGKNARDKYSYPIDATAEDWKGVKADQIGIISGGNEVFVDDIRRVVETFQVHNPRVEYLEAVNEAHDVVMVDRMFGLKHEIESEEFMFRWMLARLES